MNYCRLLLIWCWPLQRHLWPLCCFPQQCLASLLVEVIKIQKQRYSNVNFFVSCLIIKINYVLINHYLLESQLFLKFVLLPALFLDIIAYEHLTCYLAPATAAEVLVSITCVSLQYYLSLCWFVTWSARLWEQLQLFS